MFNQPNHHPDRCPRHPNAPFRVIKRGNFTHIDVVQYVCSEGDETPLGWVYQDRQSKIQRSGPRRCDVSEIWSNIEYQDYQDVTVTVAYILAVVSVLAMVSFALVWYPVSMHMPWLALAVCSVPVPVAVWICKRRKHAPAKSEV